MTKDEPVEFADDDQIVIIHDELAEAEADDPTFGGMRGNEIEEAFEQAVAQLRELHRDRFRHNPPTDPLVLFEELASELVLPGEEELRLLITKSQENEHFSVEEQERVVKAVQRFRALRSCA